MTPLIEVDRVCKSFGGLRALAECSLDVPEGSITGVIGPNGSGKTTLFNVTTGYERANDGEPVEHWAPRLISMGVDYNDFVRTTGRIERWEEWHGAWTQTAEEHLEQAAEAERTGHGLSAGEAYLRAALCLHFAKFVWVLDIERHRATTHRAIAALAKAHEHLDPTAQRIEAPLDGALLAANLRLPPGSERSPLVLLIPGLDSTKEEFFHLEDVFLARGLPPSRWTAPDRARRAFRCRSGRTTRWRSRRCSRPWPAEMAWTSSGSGPSG